ncbi:cell division protein ZipA C-terminal FtsZ-binding domain-containing protein [Thiomicrospira microaerophila]|uniref:cell division protein ZipA C-terminal FtsZ-binding domain-containing protein n=1 Tax=Thiomicrospira microaerophila TaxID=406020 RepID=UPI0005CAB179|nr:cell division protein ZipA C-terminal FtsZ-binding domain-containing protein [Thiomicrospira microaerophila]
MNELQQVLLVFAVIVVVGLYFFSRQRSQKNKANNTSASKETLKQKMAEHLVPSSMPKEPHAAEGSIAQMDRAQASGLPPHLQGKTQEELDFESRQQLLQLDESAMAEQAYPSSNYQTSVPNHASQPVHKVIEIDDLELVDERFVGRYQAQPGSSRQETAQGGAPAHSPAHQPAAQSSYSHSPQGQAAQSVQQPVEPQVFAILVLFTQTDMSVNRLMSHLKIFGLVYDERGIYVKKAGNRTIVKVANVMEPGLFPAEPDETMKTPGIALILELPSAIPAPGAMEELIMTARRISQALEGRMYDMQRHLLRESDIQAMREAALNFETTKLQ